MTLVAPFPWYGSKRRAAGLIWERLGRPERYLEGFGGSLAVLLSRPGGAHGMEIVCDLDGGIANFWRAVRSDPEQVAHHADWPTIHHDLTARHAWLRRWLAEHSRRLMEDPDWCHHRAAGWWVWGLSLWIGGGWCAEDHDRRPSVGKHTSGRGVSMQRRDLSGRMPHVDPTGGGQGVAMQRRDLSGQRRELSGQRPFVDPRGGGQGVAMQRRELSGQIPHVSSRGGGQGVAMQRAALSGKRPFVNSRGGGQGVAMQRAARPELVRWFEELADRLEAVTVLCRDWRSITSTTLLGDTRTTRLDPDRIAVVLDPPYSTADRAGSLYTRGDLDGTSDDVAAESWQWAVEHGDRYRVVYCCHEGDVAVPDGWTAETLSFAGIRRADRQSRRDMILFSPRCTAHPHPHPSLFDHQPTHQPTLTTA